MERRRRARLLGAFAIVIALHVTIGWLFLATTRWLSVRRTQSPGLEIVFITPPAVRFEKELPSPTNGMNPASSHRQAHTHAPARSDEMRPADEDNAIHAPIDWTDEISRAAANAVPDETTQSPKDFGFPRPSAAPPAKTEEFGWSHTQTHRVESIPGGGILVNLNDNCVLVFFPLPFIGCGIGKRKANGDLFKHMRDPAQTGDASDTK